MTTAASAIKAEAAVVSWVFQIDTAVFAPEAASGSLSVIAFWNSRISSRYMFTVYRAFAFSIFFPKRRDSIRYDKKPTSAASKAISHQPTFRTKKIIKLTLGIREIICQVYESLCMSGRESFMAMGAIAAKRIAIKTNWPKTSRGKDCCGIRATAEFSAQKPKPAQIMYLFCILFISERLSKEASIAF